MLEQEPKLFRVGIIGCGDIFTSHAQAYPEHPNAIVVGFYDRIHSRAEKWKQNFIRFMDMIRETAGDGHDPEDEWDRKRCELFTHEVKVYDSIEELISKVDVVDVCAPNYAHAPYALWALAQNKSVMTEKPPARCSLETKRIMEAQKTAKGQYQLNENMLWQVYIRELYKHTWDGTIGELVKLEVKLGHGGPSWGWNNHFMNPTLSGGGAMADMGIHAIGMMYGILGSKFRVKQVNTVEMKSGTKPERTMSDSDGANEYLMHKFMVEDDAKIEIVLVDPNSQKEISVSMETSWSRTMQVIKVMGTQGVMEISSDDKKRKIIVVTDSTGNLKQIGIPPQGRDSHQLEIIDFLDRLAVGKPPYLHSGWSHEMQTIISAAYLSNLNKKPVTPADLDIFYEKMEKSGCPPHILLEEIVYTFMAPFTEEY
jgi:predicted dehydrogenase